MRASGFGMGKQHVPMPREQDPGHGSIQNDAAPPPESTIEAAP
jgi:hypothetical protein